jgi:hypothetical protein
MTTRSHLLMRRLTTAAAIVLLATACAPDQRESGGGAPRDRQLSVTAWDTVWAIGGSNQDSLLLNPFLVAADGSTVYVFEGGASRLLAFDARAGLLRWAAGRSGGGPLEFRRVRDLKIGADGSPVLLDIGNQRITRLSAESALRDEIALLSIGYAEQMALLADGKFVLLTDHPDSAFAVVDESGKLVERFALPWKRFAELHPLVRQGSIASSRDGQSWAFAFSLGDGWMPFRSVRATGDLKPYVEASEFPQVVQKTEGNSVTTELASYAPCSACSAAMDGSDLYIHFGGLTQHRRRVLDRYDRERGEYRESYLLPVEAIAVAVADGVVYALIEEPYPTLLALRPRRE